MVRYVIAAVLGCVYVAGSVWIVHNEGESFRNSLRQPGSSPAVAANPPASETGTARTGQPAATQPAERSREPEKTAEPLFARATEPPAPADRGPRPKAATKKKQRPKSESPSTREITQARPKSASRPVVTAKAPAAAEPESADAVAKVQAFWDQPSIKKSWDIDAIMKSAEEEMNLGRELHDVIVQLHPVVEDSLLRRVEETAEPLLKTVSRKDIRYTFTILDSDNVNAFSHPGGFVYVTRGLFNMVGEDENYALEFALGHEIAHVDLKHALRCLQDNGVKKFPWGTIQKLYGLIIPAAYLDEQEYEADAWVFRRMRALGRTNRECLAFLNKLEGYATIHGFGNGRAKPNQGSAMIDNHLPAHTAAYKRLKKLKEIRDQASQPSK